MEEQRHIYERAIAHNAGPVQVSYIFILIVQPTEILLKLYPKGLAEASQINRLYNS
jgi:hypothetical protein